MLIRLPPKEYLHHPKVSHWPSMLSLPLVRTIKCDVCQIYNSPLRVNVCTHLHVCAFYSEQMRASATAVKAINTCLEVFVCGCVWFLATAVVVCCILCSCLTYLISNIHVYLWDADSQCRFLFRFGKWLDSTCPVLVCFVYDRRADMSTQQLHFGEHWHSTLFFLLLLLLLTFYYVSLFITYYSSRNFNIFMCWCGCKQPSHRSEISQDFEFVFNICSWSLFFPHAGNTLSYMLTFIQRFGSTLKVPNNT